MGTVFAARHLELGDTVAVKVLQSESAFATLEAEHLERFLREARLSAKIKNEHVVRVIDVARGKSGAPPYIVMELLDGIDLGDLLRSLGRIRIPDAVDYVLQACEALAEAHALGIVHRDLKSSNLHVSKRADGSPLVKVLDFGISKMSDDGDANLTATSAVFGSPAYMSPEQIRSAKHVDARTDVWALDVVLYELLTSELPFRGESAAAMLASISADPYVPLRKHLPDAPEGLERAIHAAFVKDREKRTPSVVAFAESIAPFGGPSAQRALVAIARAAQREAPMAPVAVALAPPERVSDTMRVAPSLEPPAAPPQDPIERTDREMVVPAQAQVSTPLIAIGAVVAALAIGIGLLSLALYVRSKPPKHVEFPPSPVPVTVTVTAPAAPPPPSESVAPSASIAGATSIEPPAVPKKSPRTPHPPTRASAKPNHEIPDTSQRE